MAGPHHPPVPPARRGQRGVQGAPGGLGRTEGSPRFPGRREWDWVSLKTERFESTEEITRSSARIETQRRQQSPSGTLNKAQADPEKVGVFVLAAQRGWYFTDDEIEGSKEIPCAES